MIREAVHFTEVVADIVALEDHLVAARVMFDHGRLRHPQVACVGIKAQRTLVVTDLSQARQARVVVTDEAAGDRAAEVVSCDLLVQEWRVRLVWCLLEFVLQVTELVGRILIESQVDLFHVILVLAVRALHEVCYGRIVLCLLCIELGHLRRDAVALDVQRRTVLVEADSVQLLEELLFSCLPLLDGVLHAQVHLLELHDLQFLRSIGVLILRF